MGNSSIKNINNRSVLNTIQHLNEAQTILSIRERYIIKEIKKNREKENEKTIVEIHRNELKEIQALKSGIKNILLDIQKSFAQLPP